ncbi:MAG: prepilin-type cleavage/methylation domain-containing protein [Pseudomonadota bacterium]
MRRARIVSRVAGFTLTELAVVFTIVAFLLAAAMYTLSAQTEQRNFEEARRRLELAKELVLAFAIVNGRLPCPATSTSNGDEAPSGGGACTGYLPNSTNTTGFLPATAIGFKPVDASGYATDPWGNRLRYAVASNATQPTGSTGCTTPSNPDAFTTASKLKSSTNSISCAPRDLVICTATQNTVPGATPSCGTWGTAGDARPVTNQLTVVAVIISPGKNTATASGGTDEGENVDNDGVFVYHEPRPSDGQGGEYDDQLVWISAGELYGKLIAAGQLP